MSSTYAVCARFARHTVSLWTSGLFGSVAGAGLGAIVGGIVGTIVPFYGNIVGAFIGGLVGVATGFPAAVIGSVLGTRHGWRLGGGLAVLLMGSLILLPLGFSSQNDQSNFPWWPLLILAALVQIGFWSGGLIWDRIETRDGFWEKWRCLLEDKGLSQLEQHHLLYAVTGLVPFLLIGFLLFFRFFFAAAH